MAGVAYSGVGPAADTGTYWNNPGQNPPGSSLLNSSNAATTVTITGAGGTGSWNVGGNPAALLNNYEASQQQTYTFGGLNPRIQYDLYAIFNSSQAGRQTTFTTSGGSQTVTTPSNYLSVAATSSSIYAEFVGLNPNSSSQITITATKGGSSGEADVNGFQLVPLTVPTGAVSLPNTAIAAAANSVLDFGGYGPANTVGGLSLAGNLTVQNVAGGGSVAFGGDVVASANATLSLAAGAGSSPALVLAGTGNVQNIKAANGAALTLPAVSISTNTVNVGNATGGTGSVVLSGATTLTGASTPTVNVNAGSLQVSSTLSSSVGGANVQVAPGATLIGGPAGSIQVPVTVQFGGAIQPDASQALVGADRQQPHDQSPR